MIGIKTIYQPVISANCAPPSIGEIMSFKVSAENWCGVYFLISNKKIVYIGQSINIPSRIASHTNERKKAQGKAFDSYSYFLCEKNHLDYIESKLIHHYKPKYNYQQIGGGNISPIRTKRICAPISEMDLPIKKPAD